MGGKASTLRAPSAKANRGWEFVVVRKQETKDRLGEILGQDFLREAPVLIIPAIKKSVSVAPVQDLSVVSENIFLQAVEMGLGTVWKEVLGIPEDFLVINIIPLGYARNEKEPYKEEEIGREKIHWEKF